MDEPRLGRPGRIGAQPAQPQLDCGQGLADFVQLALPLIDLGEGGVAFDRRQQRTYFRNRQ